MLVRLEMDAKRMNIPSFDHLPAWAALVGLAAHLAAGFALGILHFRSLWWSARRFGERGSLAAVIALMIGRFALIGGVLALVSLEGALPLLTVALGVLVARFAVTKSVQEAAS
jgi:F1F0 ATPase subunit 2